MNIKKILAGGLLTGLLMSGTCLAIPNPYVSYSSIEQAEKVAAVGNIFTVPEDTYMIENIYVVDGKLLDLQYINKFDYQKKVDYRVARKSRLNENISGVFTNNWEEYNVGSVYMHVAEASDNYWVAYWSDEKNSYSISAKNMERDEFIPLAVDLYLKDDPYLTRDPIKEAGKYRLPSGLIVENIEESENEIEYKYPIFSGGSKDFMENVNYTLKKGRERFAEGRDVIDVADGHFDSGKWYCDIKMNNKKYLSVVAIEWTYNEGAAHGNYVPVGYVFDVNTGKQLKLSDFAEKITKKVENLKKTDLRRYSDNSVFTGELIGTPAASYDNFFLNPYGQICLIFAPYDVSTYAEGILYMPIGDIK